MKNKRIREAIAYLGLELGCIVKLSDMEKIAVEAKVTLRDVMRYLRYEREV